MSESNDRDYEEAILRYRQDRDTAAAKNREVSAKIIEREIIDFLEGAAHDDGGNAARYFPAIMVAAMARHIADALNK